MTTKASIEEELGVPSNALPLPSKVASWCSNVIINIAEGSTKREAKVELSSETCLRKECGARCIIVGRQAKFADIRLDHKSISRRHFFFFYKAKEVDGQYELFMQDNGTKHGTFLNGERVGSKDAVLLKNGDAIGIGTMKNVTLVVSIDDQRTTGEKQQQQQQQQQQKEEEKETEGKEELTGRAKREAEIQKMMQSLDEKPTYTKFVPTEQPPQQLQSNNAPDENSNIQPVATSLLEQAKSKNKLPITSQCTLSVSSSASNKKHLASTIALDPSGARLLVGNSAGIINLYDFGGMNSNHANFKSIQVESEEGAGHHPITEAVYSNTGDRILVCTTSCQPKVLDRDGHEIIQFIKGDMYVTDQSKTTGHTSATTSVSWHPLERDVVLTSSIDGSARLWNVVKGKTQFSKLCCDAVYRAKDSKGRRTNVTCVTFHPSGRQFALGTSCGSIQIWSARKVGLRPDSVVYDAHGLDRSTGKGRAIHYLVYNIDGTRLASRSYCVNESDSIGDDEEDYEGSAVKIWDAKRLSKSSKALATCVGLPSLYERSNCAFSPNGKILIAGTSVKPPRKGSTSSLSSCGKIKFYEVPTSVTGRTIASSTLSEGNTAIARNIAKPIFEMDVAPTASVVQVCWHPKLNQIFVGASDGSNRILYDQELSKKGALLSTSKIARPKDDLSILLASRAPQGSAGITGPILTPHALPMFREDGSSSANKRKREKDRSDPVKSKRPEPPARGIKTGGQSGAGLNFTQFVVDSTIKNKNIAGKDPREELFKYSEGKSYVSKAYEGDKEVVLAKKTAEEEEEEMKSKKS